MPEVSVDRENCKGCGLCVEVCPGKLLQFSSEINAKGANPVISRTPRQCSGCRLCVLICPDVVITIYE